MIRDGASVFKAPHTRTAVLMLSVWCTLCFGFYGVSLWLDGRWRMVWVDAFFPCYAPKAEAGRRRQAWRLIFAATADHKQIWPMVVEKAIAKVRGSYEGIGGGRISEALAMLTGDSRRGRACL